MRGDAFLPPYDVDNDDEDDDGGADGCVAFKGADGREQFKF